MGQGTNVLFPVRFTDRGVSSAPYGSLLATLKAVTYSFGFWVQYEVVATRTLQVASLINTAGYVVAPSTDTVVSAAVDFISSGSTDLFNGMEHYVLCSVENPHVHYFLKIYLQSGYRAWK